MEISRVQVDEIFASSTHQAEAMVKLYQLVYPDWDNIKKLHGWPKCGKVLATHIAKGFMEFDRKHHPGVMPGGMWLNNGFSTLDNEYLGPWEVDPSKGEPEYEVSPGQIVELIKGA